MLCRKSNAYQKQLKQMCQILRSSRVVQQKAQGLIHGTDRLKDLMSTCHPNRKSYTFVLDPNWKVDLVDNPVNCGVTGHTELQFGGEIIFQNGRLERQVLTVVILFRAQNTADSCRGRPNLLAGQSYVVRRFHFDFDRSTTSNCTPHAHLQIGGNLNQEYLDIPESCSVRYELFDKLSSPRLPWTITDLPIVLDVFLRQFSTGLDAFLDGSDWRKLVVESEKLWLKDFYEQTAKVLSKKKNRVLFFEHCCDLSAYF